MLYSILVGVITYNTIIFSVGVLVNAAAIEGNLISFAAICFIGAYLARSSRFVRRMACWLGGIATSLILARWILLPILQGTGHTWINITGVFAGIACYIATRRYWHRRYLRRDRDNNRPAPPFGREWVRWVIAFVA